MVKNSYKCIVRFSVTVNYLLRRKRTTGGHYNDKDYEKQKAFVLSVTDNHGLFAFVISACSGGSYANSEASHGVAMKR